jgi:23S rRNA (cytidine1920-2'-O)/16S rRNA (cytidine1409-2'-O)-methyltransferase
MCAMVRLDTFLVEQEFIPTRSRAKRAILYGLVQVNATIIQKPAYSVKKTDTISILDEATKPVGYWKLRAIQTLMNAEILSSSKVCLDLGSSAGGFLEFAAEHCKQVYGVEVSDQFAPPLYQLKQKYPNVSVLIADAFLLNPLHYPELQQIDVLLNDLTLNPVDSVQALQKFLPLLKDHGYIIMAIKQGRHPLQKCKKYIKSIFLALHLHILQILNLDPDKQELHVVAQKRAS